jgi:tetratricopeptide (TPR) repeat protein
MPAKLLSMEGPMTRWTTLLATALWLALAGCAQAPTAPAPDSSVFADHLFGPPAEAPDVDRLFELTPAMRRYLVDRIEPQVWRKGAPMALIDALYAQGELRLDYDAEHTRTAAQAFDARKGNCLSLVIMTAAFARELGVQVRFQEVLDSPAIEPNGELTFVIGHVNLALGNGMGRRRGDLHDQGWLLVDFLPGQDLRRQNTRELDERRIRAQFMNNRAAEELARGRVDDAYWWLRGAWAQDAGFANLYNTLGVVYRHRGALPQAERALQAALAMDPGNEHVLGNLAGVRRSLGLDPAPRLADSARPTGSRFAQARQALDEGRLKQALLLLQGELGLTPRNPELHHLLAVAQARLGDSARARRHLELAAEYSGTGASRQLYAGKLERLKALAAEPARALQ